MTTSLFTSSQSGTTSTTSTGSTTAIAGSTADDTTKLFTSLLVAEIQNQDPTTPTDSTQFVNQLTQLSQTQSMQSLSTQGSATQTIMQSLQVLSLGAQVGSSVMASTGTVTLGSTAVTGAVTLQNASAKTTLVLTGTDQQSHKIELGTQAPGDVAFRIDPAALGLTPGTYSMQVVTDSSQTTTIQVAGSISGVKVSASGTPVVTVTNIGDVAPGALTRYTGKTAATSG